MKQINQRHQTAKKGPSRPIPVRCGNMPTGMVVGGTCRGKSRKGKPAGTGGRYGRYAGHDRPMAAVPPWWLELPDSKGMLSWKQEYASGDSTQALYYLHRDHLNSIVLITDTAGYAVEKRQFDACASPCLSRTGFGKLASGGGNVVRLTDGNGNDLPAFVLLDRGYTGHEHLLGVGLINMNARLYDPRLHRMLSPDNFVQDPYGTQHFNRYGYALNNPLVYVDENGEFFFAILAPIVGKLVAGIVSGAVIGATVSAATYSVAGAITGDFTWSGLGTAALYGGIAGGISGGLSAIGGMTGFTSTASSAGKFWQNSTFGMLKGTASQVGTNLIFGNDFTFGSVVGGVAGGFLSAGLPNWHAVKGGWLANAGGELLHGTAKGAVVGFASGGIAAAIDGERFWDGAIRGLRDGALGGFSRSAAMIAAFGATYRLNRSPITPPKGVNFRQGGIYQALNSREVTWGNSIVTNSETLSLTVKHELVHYVQYLRQGWAIFQGRGVYEQMLESFFRGDVYNYGKHGTRYQESEAQYWQSRVWPNN